MHRPPPAFARHNFRRRRWQCLVLQRFPDAPAEPSHCHVGVDVEWIVTPAGYKCGCQAAIDLPATAHGSSNNLARKHNRRVGVGVGVTVGVVAVAVAVGVTVGVAVRPVAVGVTVAVGVAVGVAVAVAVGVAVGVGVGVGVAGAAKPLTRTTYVSLLWKTGSLQ